MIKLRPTILDKYIIRKFIGTYLAALLIIIGIVIIFDISYLLMIFFLNIVISVESKRTISLIFNFLSFAK